jgi:hypothetical protein
MKKKANLFPLPISALKFLSFIFGKREKIDKLVDTLRIGNIYTKETLNRILLISVEDGIKKMV